MNFETLINEAQKALNQIAAHDDFLKMLELGLWEDPAISLSDARQGIDDLLKIYQENKAQSAME